MFPPKKKLHIKTWEWSESVSLRPLLDELIDWDTIKLQDVQKQKWNAFRDFVNQLQKLKVYFDISNLQILILLKF